MKLIECTCMWRALLDPGSKLVAMTLLCQAVLSLQIRATVLAFRLFPSLPLCYCLDWIYRSLWSRTRYGGLPRGSTSGDSQQYSYYNYGVSLVTSGSVQGPHLAHPQPVSGDRNRKNVYSLKIINPKRKSLFEAC